MIPADVSARAALGALLEAHPAPLTPAELVRIVSGGETVVADAIAGLARDGLANVEGDLVFASRAAVRGDALRV